MGTATIFLWLPDFWCVYSLRGRWESMSPTSSMTGYWWIPRCLNPMQVITAACALECSRHIMSERQYSTHALSSGSWGISPRSSAMLPSHWRYKCPNHVSIITNFLALGVVPSICHSHHSLRKEPSPTRVTAALISGHKHGCLECNLPVRSWPFAKQHQPLLQWGLFIYRFIFPGMNSMLWIGAQIQTKDSWLQL